MKSTSALRSLGACLGTTLPFALFALAASGCGSDGVRVPTDWPIDSPAPDPAPEMLTALAWSSPGRHDRPRCAAAAARGRPGPPGRARRVGARGAARDAHAADLELLVASHPEIQAHLASHPEQRAQLQARLDEACQRSPAPRAFFVATGSRLAYPSCRCSRSAPRCSSSCRTAPWPRSR